MADAKNQGKKLVYESQASMYEKALKTMENESLIIKEAFKADNYLKAAKMFEEVGDYKDSVQLMKECREKAAESREKARAYQYKLAVSQKQEAVTSKDFEKASKSFGAIPGYLDADTLKKECDEMHGRMQKKASVRKLIFMGILALLAVAAVIFFNTPVWHRTWAYISGAKTEEEEKQEKLEQEKKEAEKPKEITIANAEPGQEFVFGNYDWYLLERNGNEAKLLLDHAEKHEELRNRPYNDKLTDVTWEDSTLRAWLNGEFLKKGFSKEEQERLLEQDIVNEDNPEYGTSGGNPTRDKVTILSAEEIGTYADIIRLIRMNVWIRMPGNAQDTAAYMSQRNSVMYYGYPVSSEEFYTCPVILVNTEGLEEPEEEEEKEG